MRNIKAILDLLEELGKNEAVDKATALGTVRTVLQFEQAMPHEPVAGESKKQSKKKDKSRMIDGKEGIAVLETAPPDGWTEAEIYEQGMAMKMPWSDNRELGILMVSRRLSKDRSSVYRKLANGKWVLRRKVVVSLKEGA